MLSLVIVLYDRYIRIVRFIRGNAFQVFMATIYGTGAAFTSHEIMARGRFYFVATDIAANGVPNYFHRIPPVPTVIVLD